MISIVAKTASKLARKATKIDPNNPITQMDWSWAVDIAKEIIKPF